jgi:hypothetical protein
MKCQFPNCTNNAINGVYCIGHAKFTELPDDMPKPVPRQSKPKNGIKPMSDKTRELYKTYEPRKKAFLARPENQVCLIRSKECTVKATHVHHKKRRGVNLVNERYWEPCCKNCNTYVEQHVEWARLNGHLLSVHQIERSTPAV